MICCRMILNVLYTMVEIMRVESEQETPTQKKNREAFAAELGNTSYCTIYTSAVEKFIKIILALSNSSLGCLSKLIIRRLWV